MMNDFCLAMAMTSSSRHYDHHHYYYASLTILLLATAALFYIHASGGSDATTSSSWQPTSGGPMTMSRHLTSFLDEDEDLLPPHVFPLRYPQDYLGFGCAILGLLLAAGGGIGGGGMLVPIYILLLQFPVKHAIPLASITVFGGAIANNILNVKKCHPLFPQRPAIDWDLMLLLVPTMIAGAVVGAVLNKLFPDILLAVLMLLLLSITAKETLGKAMKMYREEERVIVLRNGGGECHDDVIGDNDDDDDDVDAEKRSGSKSSPRATEETPLIVSRSNEMHLETDISTTQHDDSEAIFESNCIIKNHNDQSLLLHEKSMRRQCIDDAIKLITLFTFVVVVDVMQKSSLVQSCGTYCHWGSDLLLFLIIALFTHRARSDILARRNSSGPIVSEIGWDESNTTIYPLFSILAGIVAGMFGIGGGIIVGPLMLAIGVHPQVASATSACMVLFSSATSTLSFLIFGYLRGDYATFCLVLGFLSTILGQTVMSMLLAWSGGRNSYIAFCVGVVVGISAVAMGVESVVAIVKGC